MDVEAIEGVRKREAVLSEDVWLIFRCCIEHGLIESEEKLHEIDVMRCQTFRCSLIDVDRDIRLSCFCDDVFCPDEGILDVWSRVSIEGKSFVPVEINILLPILSEVRVFDSSY